MPFPLRPSSLAVAAIAVAVLLGSTACGSADEEAQPSDTTTGTIDRSTSTTTAPPGSDGSDPEADGLPGLWLATPAGITDETGDRYAVPGPDETLRSPIDDTRGGVFYLRCVKDQTTCRLEHATERNGTPTPLGEASDLLAFGVFHQRAVLVTSWTDPTRVPTPETDTGSLVGRLVDAETGQVAATAPWYGWESGPFAIDVEADVIAACFGEGESCQLNLLAAPDAVPAPVPDTDLSTVTSLALDPTGKVLTWVESMPMSGNVVTAHVRDLAAGTVADTPLRTDADAAVDDSVTDGAWVALRSGEKVELRELAGEKQSGTRTVPASVTGMAIRPVGGGGGSNSSL